MALFTLSGVLLGLTVLYIIKQLLFKTTQAPLPPGPKGKPLIGNLGYLPPPGTKDWEHWARFKELYGILTVYPAAHMLTAQAPLAPSPSSGRPWSFSTMLRWRST